jgi:hypothetical protein
LLNGAQSDTEGISHLSLSFSGNLNENPAVPWIDGDIRLVITYSMENVLPEMDEEEAELLEEEASATDDSTQQDSAEPTPEPTPSAIPTEETPSDTSSTEPSGESTAAESIPPESDTQVAGATDKPPEGAPSPVPIEGESSPEPAPPT